MSLPQVVTPDSAAPPVDAYFDGHGEPEWPPIGVTTHVGVDNDAPTGYGPPNQQQYQSGHTQNLVTNPSAEQGQGVGPERLWPHYPHAEQPNPFRNLNVFQRSGQDSYSPNVYRPEVAAYWAQSLGIEQQSSATRNRSPVAPVVDQYPSVPYVQTIGPYPGGY